MELNMFFRFFFLFNEWFHYPESILKKNCLDKKKNPYLHRKKGYININNNFHQAQSSVQYALPFKLKSFRIFLNLYFNVCSVCDKRGKIQHQQSFHSNRYICFIKDENRLKKFVFFSRVYRIWNMCYFTCNLKINMIKWSH